MKYPHTAYFICVLAGVLGGKTANAGDCGSPGPDWIFCEDFENTDLSQWDADTQTLDQYRTILADSGPSGSQGNHVFRLRVPAGRGGTGINKTFTPNEYDVLYARWYIAYENGFDFTALNHGHGLHAGDRWKKGVAGTRPQGDDWFTVQVEYLPVSASNPQPRMYMYAYYRGMTMDCSDPNGSCWGDSIPCMLAATYCNRAPNLGVRTLPPALEHNRWYCVEMMINAGDPVDSQSAANGVLDMWIDDKEIGPWNNMWFRTASSLRINHFWLGLFHHADHSVEGLLYDDIAVSTSRIGCSNTIHPQPPANLQVN
jgi:hypothetical protein